MITSPVFLRIHVGRVQPDGTLRGFAKL